MLKVIFLISSLMSFGLSAKILDGTYRCIMSGDTMPQPFQVDLDVGQNEVNLSFILGSLKFDLDQDWQVITNNPVPVEYKAQRFENIVIIRYEIQSPSDPMFVTLTLSNNNSGYNMRWNHQILNPSSRYGILENVDEGSCTLL